MRKGWVFILKVKVTLWAHILTKAKAFFHYIFPELLNLLQPDLVWWYIITSWSVVLPFLIVVRKVEDHAQTLFSYYNIHFYLVQGNILGIGFF